MIKWQICLVLIHVTPSETEYLAIGHKNSVFRKLSETFLRVYIEVWSPRFHGISGLFFEVHGHLKICCIKLFLSCIIHV